MNDYQTQYIQEMQIIRSIFKDHFDNQSQALMLVKNCKKIQEIQNIQFKHQIFCRFPQIIIKKSMKFLTFASASILLSLFIKAQSLQCGENKVANSISVCIEPEYIEGCQKYKWINQCAQCQPGYHLNQGKCDYVLGSDAVPQIFGCLEKGKTQECINCANGYLLKQGKCQKGVANCAKYETDLTCAQCKTDYSLVVNTCRHNILLGCKQQSQDHNCQECWTPFQLNGDHCDIKDCQTLNDYGCVTCQCGYYLTSERKCKEIDNGCLRYQRGHCVNCLPHYKLKGGYCEIQGCMDYQNHYCMKCQDKYNLVDGGCQFKNCFDWAHDQCLVCDKGYRVSKGLCIQSEDLVCK